MPQPPQRPGVPRIGGPAPEIETGKDRRASERLEDACKDLEEELEEVKVKYDMYFLGVERMEPARRRDDLKRAVARLQTAFTRNAGLRFRIQALHARYLSYERLWVRSAREKEEGTYRRDLVRARRKAAARGAPGAGAPARGRRGALEAEDVDLDGLTGEESEAAEAAGEALAGAAGASPGAAAAPAGVAPAASPAATPVATPPAPAGLAAKAPAAPPAARPPAPSRTPPPGAPPAPPPAPPPGLPEAQMRALYEAYVAAKRRCNEDTSRVTYEAVARSVNKQLPEVARLYRAREVEFKVVIKDGKAILKAVPKP